MYITPDHNTPEKIKAEFRRLAKIHHPDKGGNANTFREILKEYKTLEANNFQHQNAKNKGKYIKVNFATGDVEIEGFEDYDFLINIFTNAFSTKAS